MIDSDPGTAVDALARRREIADTIREVAVLSTTYVVMNGLAAVIASYGLIENSAAVVIGAMIVAMLLGPISGISLALVTRDDILLRRAIIAEVVGVAIVLAISFLIGKAHEQMPLTAETLSRTSPNILDLMIALAGGAAGAYAAVSPKLSASLVGVAVATALVPPLASCSICLAHGESKLAFGGFLLFFANFVAIQFASSAVFLLHGFQKLSPRASDVRHLVRRQMISCILLVGMAFLLGYDFSRSVQRQEFQESVRRVLEHELMAYPGAHLADVSYGAGGYPEVVIALVRSPYSFTPERVAKIQKGLPKDGRVPIALHIQTVITKEATATRYVDVGAQPPDGADQSSEVGVPTPDSTTQSPNTGVPTPDSSGQSPDVGAPLSTGQ